jgi:putative ABC transport system permease protein
VPLVAGRFFDSQDVSDGVPVLVVNARASQQLFGGPTAAIGQRLRLGAEPSRQIVGVVGNVRSSFFNTLEWRTDPILYRPSAQAFSTVDNPSATSFGFNVHIRSNRALSLADVRAAASSVSSRAAVTELQRVADAIAIATRQPALRMRLLLALSIVSLLLTAIGVYGIVSQAVAYRRREVAIRIAVGAAPMGIMATVTRKVLVSGVAGLIVGGLAALMLSSTLEALLFGVRSRDLLSFGVAGIALLGVTTIAALIPAHRAVRTDPVTVLRAD